MGLDTAPLLAALNPPSFTHEGTTWEGKHLSILEWAKYLERLGVLGTKRLDLVSQQRLYRDLANAWFKPARRRWFGARERTVGDVILTLPPAVQDQVMASFIRSQHRALGLMVPDSGSIGKAPTRTA